jgi:Large polyvalent protein associated domain 38
MSDVNPFDALAEQFTPEELKGLQDMPRPSLLERFRANEEQAYYTGTLAGGIKGQTTEQVARDQAVAAYDSTPQWETPLEGLAALGGQMWGSIQTPESMVGELGLGAKAVEAVGIKSATWMARMFGGAVDAGIVNAGVDAVVQGAEVGGGDRTSFDPTQTALATGLGAALGGLVGGLQGPAKKALDGALPEPSPAELLGNPDVVQRKAEYGVPAKVVDAQQKPTPIPDNAIPGSEAGIAPEIIAQEPPALGDVLDAQARVVRGLPARVEEPKEAPLPDAKVAVDMPVKDGQSAGTFVFDPRELAVDADRFQFKSGGDAKGVIDTLKRITRWIPERGNQLIVWQDKSGRNFVVDGHQRTGLARRLLSEGQAHDIKIPGVLFREVDGVSAENVMVVAALKNIAEGNASPIDGAKIIRMAGKDALKDMPLSKEAVRTAADLATLDDAAFKLVVNEVVDPAHAKYVGRFIPDDPVRQKAAMDVLAKADPANEDEAAILVRRVMDAEIVKTDGGNQVDMFGSDPESTALDEVRIVASVIRALRSDQKLFKRVFKDADRIEKAGSKVARDESQAAADFAARAALSVEKQAFRAGALRDRLKALAVEVKHGRQTIAQARTAFLDQLAEENIRLDANRGDAGGPGGPEEIAAPATEKGADGKPQSVLDGAAKIGDGALAQRLADQPLKPTANQKLTLGEDGLFGDGHKQDEMFSLAQGPRLGQLGRDVAGVAATVDEVLEPPLAIAVRDVANDLVKALDVVAVRFGRITKPKADGIYKVGSGVIRLHNPKQFEVLAHEMGHHLEQLIGDAVKVLMRRHAAELEPMAYAGADLKVVLQEGFAEYMRTFVTNPAYSATQAPLFDTAFRAMLARQNPEILAALDKGAKAWAAYRDQTSERAVAATIVSRKKPSPPAKLLKELQEHGLGHTIHEGIVDFTRAYVDRLDPLNQVTRGLAAVYKKNHGGKLMELNSVDNPYDLAQGLPGAYQAGFIDIMHGVVEFRGRKIVSTPLRDAIVKAMGGANVLSKWNEVRLKGFDSYLKSKRMLGEWERFDRGLIPNPPDELNRGDHAQNIKDLEAAYPSFAEAAPMVYDFNLALWAKKRDAGLITEEQYQGGLLVKDYVPIMRVFEEAGDGAGTAGKKVSSLKSGTVKRFVGSERDSYSAIESIVSDALETSLAIAKNEQIKAFDLMARRAGPGSGAFVERIPAHEMKAIRVEALEAVDATAKAQGMSALDYLAVRSAVEDKFGEGAGGTIFRPSVINEKGEPIAFFREAGELRAIRFADGEFGQQIHAAMNVMNTQEHNLFMKMLSISAKVQRASITADPSFALMNFIRDQALAQIFYGLNPMHLVRAAKGMVEEVFSRDAAREYSAMGGHMPGEMSASLRDVQFKHDVQVLRRKGYLVNLLPYKTDVAGVPVIGFPIKRWLSLTEVAETGGRIGLYKMFYKEAKGRGLDDYEAMKEASHLSQDHLNFGRRGSQMQGLARIIPFLNASVQGLNKSWRVMLKPFFQEAVTTAEQRAKAQAVKAWASLSAITLATMALDAMMQEHEEYRSMNPTTKARHWMVKFAGEWWAVPKPFEVGAVINAGPAAYSAIKKNDPRWAEDYLQGLYDVILPPNLMQGNPLIAESFQQATGVDLYTKQQIVPDQLKPLQPWQQYNQTTSQFFMDLGKAFDKSPMLMEHMFEAQTGTLGRSMLSLYDYAGSDKPHQGWADFAVTRRFIKNASRGATSTRAFWDLVGTRNGKLEGARKSWDAMNEAGDLVAASDFLAQQDATTKAWITLGSAKPEVRRLHPFTRARSAVSAVNDLLRDLVKADIETAGGNIHVDGRDRGAAKIILENLAMTEALNALSIMKVPGWADRAVMETAGYYRELEAVSPDLAKALADRFATAKVLPLDVVEKLWPEVQARLLKDGGDMLQTDLVARAKAAGFEMDGKAIKRKPRNKVNLQ